MRLLVVFLTGRFENPRGFQVGYAKVRVCTVPVPLAGVSETWRLFRPLFQRCKDILSTWVIQTPNFNVAHVTRAVDYIRQRLLYLRTGGLSCFKFKSVKTSVYRAPHPPFPSPAHLAAWYQWKYHFSSFVTNKKNSCIAPLALCSSCDIKNEIGMSSPNKHVSISNAISASITVHTCPSIHNLCSCYVD